jgi:hypothetical protein
MVLLTEGKSERLNNPGLFYSISGIDHDFHIKEPEDFLKEKKLSSSGLTVSTSYLPVFDFLKEIYQKSSSATDFNSIIFTGKRKNPVNNSIENFPCNKKCIILVHGFKSRKKEIYIQLGKRFAGKGIDGIVYTLPFHFERRYLDKNGEDVLGLKDFRATLEFFRQTVIELRILIRVLKEIGYRSVGLLGFSFGGFCCSLVSCFDRSVDFIIPLGSMGGLGNLLTFKKGKAGLDLNDEQGRINDFFSTNYLDLICPINYKPLINKEFIQGLFDRRAPYQEVIKFLGKWGNPKTIWFPCDHVTFFLYNNLTLLLALRFVRKLEI